MKGGKGNKRGEGVKVKGERGKGQGVRSSVFEERLRKLFQTII